MCHEVTIVTAVHNIKSNKGSKTAGVDEIKMDSYLQMPKQELIDLIQRKYGTAPAMQTQMQRYQTAEMVRHHAKIQLSFCR